jgi:hypothetical protein
MNILARVESMELSATPPRVAEIKSQPVTGDQKDRVGAKLEKCE